MPDLQYPILGGLIGQFEGFGKPGTLATQNNNPGNIINGTFAQAHGSVGENAGFAVFPDVTTGAVAEDALIQHYANQGATVQSMMNAWAPGNAPGNTPEGTQNYINFITGKLGVTPDTPVSQAEKKTPDIGSSNSASGLCSGPLSYLLPQCAAPALVGAITGTPVPGSQAAGLGSFTWGRIGAFLIGLILIAGGLYLFKPVQNVVNKSVTAIA